MLGSIIVLFTNICTLPTVAPSSQGRNLNRQPLWLSLMVLQPLF